MKSTYNNPNLIQNHDYVHSDVAGLLKENNFLKEVISIILAFNVVACIVGVATAIIFFAAK
ncbi:MAG: hypothetical protein J7577_13465 [Sphingobacteriaceae bacterium]|nr:hypothetical protein [Sphingobacteriaceae bacterium]